MNKINLDTLKIPSNLVLIKPDPDFEFVLVKPESEFSAINEEQKLWIGYDPETMARHYGVTGKVLKLPEQLVFNGKACDALREEIGSGRTRADQIRLSELNDASLQYNVQNELEVDDKVWFDYLCQISAFEEKLVVDVEGYGNCFFVKYDSLYCYERNGEINLLNGFVWIERIKADDKTDTGLHLVPNEKHIHVPKKAIVVKAGKAVKEYLDDDVEEDPIELKEGDEILFDDRFGHEVEYSMHRKLADKEVLCLRRKNIYAVLKSKKSKVKSKKTTGSSLVNDGVIEPYFSNKINCTT